MKENKAVKLTKDGTKQAAEVLAKAFYTDPLMVYILPDEEERKRKLPKLTKKVVRYCRKFNTVDMTPDGKAAACWLPPGHTNIKYGQKIRTGALTVPFIVGWTGYRRLLRVMNTMDKMKKKHAPPSHWYLFMLGVDPENQGQGAGSSLLQAKFAEAQKKKETSACYLETMNDRTIPLYEKHGFHVCEEVTIDAESSEGFSIWAMKKEEDGGEPNK